ncbi:hypothetical protein GGF31_004110 [Allomyces arbusculus]|nr:hypothetical protein GGF31_004110 [Allomyces arbusculus]
MSSSSNSTHTSKSINPAPTSTMTSTSTPTAPPANAHLRRRVKSNQASQIPSDALSALDNTRIRQIRPLLPPQILLEEIPLTDEAAVTVALARQQVSAIVKGQDDRLLVVVGPCSIHDTAAALDYARRLHEYAQKAASDLLIVMRVYFEKPRTTVGWKGLINDPDLDGSFQINKGLRLARQLLVDINGTIGLPCAGECLDTISPQFVADLYSWAAIGARTTSSQVHRELASGLSMAVGFKNDTDGNVKVAADAIMSASSPHHFLSVTKQGLTAIVGTSGNDTCHAILRGGSKGPNYDEASVMGAVAALNKNGVRPHLMIDASHGNSSKDHNRQPIVLDEVARQLAETESGNYITGVMIESNIAEGRQDLNEEVGPAGLVYGKSITDACIDFQTTLNTLDRLRAGVQARRARRNAAPAAAKGKDGNRLFLDFNPFIAPHPLRTKQSATIMNYTAAILDVVPPTVASWLAQAEVLAGDAAAIAGPILADATIKAQAAAAWAAEQPLEVYLDAAKRVPSYGELGVKVLENYGGVFVSYVTALHATRVCFGLFSNHHSSVSLLHSWVAMCVLSFGGTTLSAFLLGHPPGWLLSNTTLPIYTAIYLLFRYGPAHRILRLISFPTHLACAVGDGLARALAITRLGVDTVLARHPGSYVAMLICGTLCGCGGGLLNSTFGFSQASWKLGVPVVSMDVVLAMVVATGYTAAVTLGVDREEARGVACVVAVMVLVLQVLKNALFGSSAASMQPVPPVMQVVQQVAAELEEDAQGMSNVKKATTVRAPLTPRGKHKLVKQN